MKIPKFTSARYVQDDTAYRERRVVSKDEFTSARQSEDCYRSREAFLKMKDQYPKKAALGKYLADYLKSLSAKSVLGLGSGESFHEYAIKLAASEIRITATDFDPFIVEKVSEFLPEIDNFEVFDIKKDDFNRFQNKYDTILMVGVIYALSDDEIVGFFKRVISTGMKHILVVTSLLPVSHGLRFYSIRFIGYNPLALFVKKHVSRIIGRPGRFHGWSRSEGEFARLIKKAGALKLHKIISLKPVSETEVLLHITPI